MIYEKMTEPPTPGTPLESLMLLVWRMRQDIEFDKTRVMVNAILASGVEGEAASAADKDVQNSWQDFLDACFPYQKGTRVRTDQAAIDFLKEEVAKGPLTVTPLQPVGKAKSKLKSRYVKRAEK